MAKRALLGLALLIGCSSGGGGTGGGGAGGTGGAGGMSGMGGAATCTGTVLFWCLASCGEPHEAVICDGGQWGCPLGSIRSDACPTGGTSGSAGTTGAGGSSGGASGGSGGSASGSAGAGGGAGVGGAGARGGAGGSAGGAAGQGGAGGRGGGGGVGGGPPCGPPPSHPTFNCAPTYDEQAAVTSCGLGGSVTKGACGASWGWRCQSVYTLTCIYDSQKNLAADRWCPDLGACSASCPSVIGFDACIDDIGRPTDAGAGT